MLSLIAAISKNNCIGKNGELPWSLPEDMKHFKEVTMGKAVIMGRKTWESIPEKFRPLKGREYIVITRQENYTVPEGVHVFHSLDEAINKNKDQETICIGGGELYKQVMEKADILYMTYIDRTVNECDTFFPHIDLNLWKERERDDRDGFSFVTYKRR